MFTRKSLSLFSTVAVFLLTACSTPPARQHTPPPPIDSGPTVADLRERDGVVVTASESIDSIVVGTPQEVPVKVETDAIRTAVSNAPAEATAKLAKAFEDRERELNRTISSLLEKIEKHKTEALRTQVKYLNWLGFGLIGVFALSFIGGPATALKTWPLILLSGGCFALAQIIGSPWFAKVFIGLAGAAVAYGIYWAAVLLPKHQRQGQVLRKIVPVLDGARKGVKEGASVAVEDIFSRLKEAMTPQDRAEVHAARKP